MAPTGLLLVNNLLNEIILVCFLALPHRLFSQALHGVYFEEIAENNIITVSTALSAYLPLFPAGRFVLNDVVCYILP